MDDMGSVQSPTGMPKNVVPTMAPALEDLACLPAVPVNVFVILSHRAFNFRAWDLAFFSSLRDLDVAHETQFRLQAASEPSSVLRVSLIGNERKSNGR